MSSRGCDTLDAVCPVDANVTSIGRSSTTPRSMKMTIPSLRNAVLSDVNAFVCVSESLPR
jgi:hypothetical protein